MSIAEKLKAIADNEQKVWEAGKQAEYDSFWDAFQKNGERAVYSNAFNNEGWNNDNLKPKYPIVPTVANSLFSSCAYKGDLTEAVTLDFSACTNFTYLCSYAYGITRIGVIDSRASMDAGLSAMFMGSINLVTIDKLILKDDGTQTFNHTFGSARELQNITIEGTIGQDLDLSDCKKLTHSSLMSAINALQDGVTSKTCSLGTENLAKLTDQEKAIATQKGWTLA